MSEEINVKEELERLQAQYKNVFNLFVDLTDYLKRTDPNFEYNNDECTTWVDRLRNLRAAEKYNEAIQNARYMLEREGYLIVRDESEIDARKLAKWVDNKKEI